MTFRLNHQNVLEYLTQHQLCSLDEEPQIELKTAKNFNLLLKFQERYLLVKQERHNQAGKTAGEFLREWRSHQFFQHFPELNHLSSLISEALHFSATDSIIVFNYLTNYTDLAEFYVRENFFPTEIATAIGSALATIHRSTYNNPQYRDFLQNHQVVRPLSQIGRLTPEVFGQIPGDALKFFVLYQRYDSLGQAIAELLDSIEPSCLTHNDLKLNNILLHTDWQHLNHIIRLIDWERSTWGDPALDLGTLIASYLQLWLNSLVVSKTIAIEESLRLAFTPLEQLQPSIATLIEAYLHHFPEMLQYRPDFLRRVVQFAGFALIEQVQANIQYQKSFGNAGICTLQVAKSLLCRPDASISTVFGRTEAELRNYQSFKSVELAEMQRK